LGGLRALKVVGFGQLLRAFKLALGRLLHGGREKEAEGGLLGGINPNGLSSREV